MVGVVAREFAPKSSKQTPLGESLQSADMLAAAVAEKSEAFTGTFQVRAGADMVKGSKPQAVDDKAAAADGAGNFREGVK